MKKLVAILCLLFLIGGPPWVRAQAPPAHSSAPKGRPLLLLAPFTGEKLVVRAASATVQGAVLQVELPDGSRSAYDKAALVATLPWYADAEITGGTVDFAALEKLYDNAIREHVEFLAGLRTERAKVRAVANAHDQGLAAKVAAIVADRYDPAAGYTVEDLRARLLRAEEVLSRDEAHKLEVVRATAPFREHLAKLTSGQVLVNGHWRTQEEIRREKEQAEETARLQALSESLQITLSATLLDAAQVNRVLWTAGVVLGMPAVLGFVLVLRRRRLLGGALILLPVVAGVLVERALFSADLAMPLALSLPGDEEEVVDTVDAIKGNGAESPADRLRVSERGTNAFLSHHVKQSGQPADGALNLRRVAVRFRTGGVTVYESVESHGRLLVVRHDYDLTVRGGRAVVTGATTHIGDLPIPDPVQGWLRADLSAALENFLQPYAASKTYALTSISADGIALASIPVRPTPPPQTVAVSTPAATPPPAVVTPTPESSAPATAATTPAPPAEDEDTPLPPLPPAGTTPGPDNTFYVYAIWDGINGASSAEIGEQMDKLREQFGKGNRYHRVGFAFILGSEAQLRTICNLARQKNLAVGVILGTQTHSGAAKNEVKEDFRCVQWRQEGSEWHGGNGPRDSFVPTPSRYCRPVRDALEKGQQAKCEILRRVMDANPGVITCIDSTIEEELADGGQSDDAKLADYSPYAVTEFRDWLRHTGLYDADNGRYAGQGAPEHLTGSYISAKGKLRSPFYNAKTPEDSPVGGSSFNQRFGTNFKSWRLKYWDLEAFQERIVDEKFDPTPGAGKGYTEGGFDAPRKRNATLWWQAWSWDYQDNGNRYPPGPADAPAFGFRQVLVHNFVVDMLRVGLKARLPANLLFAHQIPGELTGAARNRSGATPVWTGFVPFNGTVGVTRFGPFDPKLASQYTKGNPQSRGWGIFEWHPKPFSEPDDPKLYSTATEHLRTYYQARCHHLFAGWWKTDPPKGKQDFPLADSVFAKAVKDFMGTCPDQPYPGTPR